MKAVILAGGLGTRLREETEFRPKPMVEVGGKPILWHIMKLFAHHQIVEFVIPIGYRGDVIRDYFLNYAARTNDFTICLGNTHQIEDNKRLQTGWRVTVVDTGAETPTGGRVLRASSR
jgi:glucose-1-phosphate cytidylyltransferase